LVRALLFVIAFFISSIATAQDILMSNGVSSVCSGVFYDSGGDSLDYNSNETYVYTLCSDQPGKCIQLSFQSFALEKDFDFLLLYNGPSTSSPLIGTYTGNNSPGTVSATSGCLTIKFISDYTVNKSGWKAFINCVNCPVNGCPSCNGGQPPANDACSGAQNIGMLPAPAPCPNGIGALTIINTTNLCANAEVPYNALQGCKPIGNMSNPAADVWYKFTLTAPVLEITINGLITPQVGLYSGTGCGNLVPRGCAIGGGGLLNTTFGGLSSGTYYLQISGGNLNDQCNFTLSLRNNFDCNGCVMQSNLTVNPPPVNGIYLSGQQVNFCLNITSFNPTSANWLHGITPKFGPGWDLSTLVATPPASCSNSGFWAWYANPITSSANLQTYGPGFFYETSAGNASNLADNNPGNNFGDNIGPNCNLNFCWRINTLPQSQCNFGENLNVFIETYTDGESGSWTSSACSNDPVHDLYASMACCIPPVVALTQPACFGNQGAATGTGLGTGPWKYFWKNASGIILQQTGPLNGQDLISGLNPGTYFLTTEDAFGCQSTVSFAIVQPSPLTATLTVAPTKCNLNNGSIGITASGGSSPYSYSINNGITFQSNSLFNNLAPGNYTLTIKDAHNCQVTVPASVAPSNVPVINQITTQNITCYNGNDGIITINASSGVAPYTFEIRRSNFVLTQNQNIFQNIAAGTYQLTVTDVNGCKKDTTIQLTQPPPINLTNLITPSGCNLNNGTIELNVTSNYSGTLLYSIDNGQNFQTGNLFINLSPGAYYVLVEDGNGCLVKDTVIINTINAPVLDSVRSQNLTCYRSQDGYIAVYASGGVGALSFSINNGTTYSASNIFNGLTAKAYTIVVKDNNNCLSVRPLTLSEPPPIIIRGDITATRCGLSNGSANLHPDNGFLPLEYSSDGGLNWTLSNFFGQLPAGNITFTVRDNQGCTTSRTYQIGASSAPDFNTIAIDSIKCFNTNTASITLSTNNGIPPMSYSIDGGTTFNSSNSFQNLSAGTYHLSLKDNAGCRTDSVISILQPQSLSINASVTNALCSYANGTIAITGNGGTTPYIYSIDGGATFGSNFSYTNLTTGSYKIVIRDNNHCEEATTVTINDEPRPRIIGHSFTPQICDSTNNATITLNAVSGTGTLLYSADGGQNFQINPIITSIPGGNHLAIVKDANQCADSILLNIPILKSPQINSISSEPPLCFGNTNGSITIDASGGNGMLFFSINNGVSFSASGNYNNLNAATYYIVVEDSNHCRAFDTITLNDPSPLSFQTLINPETCFQQNGSIVIETTGGTPGYFFMMNQSTPTADSVFSQLNAGNYTFTVTDNNGCTADQQATVPHLEKPVIQSVQITNLSCFGSDDGSVSILAHGHGMLTYSMDGIIFQSAPQFNNLTQGNFTLYVRDTNYCVTDTLISLTAPSAINASIQTTASNCNLSNGSISVSASGGSGQLQYALNGGNFGANAIFNNLSAGNHIITIKDAMGCSADFIASISTINGAVIDTLLYSDLVCHGDFSGAIQINATGGSGALLFSIDNGANFSSSNSFGGLPAGNYPIVVTDSAGCITTNSITLNEPDSIIIQQMVTPAICNQSNGSLQVSAIGGNAPLTYSLDGVNFSSVTIFQNLPAGIYTIYVNDVHQCITNKPISISNQSAPVINSINISQISCYGENTGAVILHASGGTGSLNYSLDQGQHYQSSSIFNNLFAGNYLVRIMDANGCIADTLINIQSPPQINAQISSTDANCQQSNGLIQVQGMGGSGLLSYCLNGSAYQPNGIFNNLSAGVYQITIRDHLMCSETYPVAVNTISGPVIDTIIKQDLSCFGIPTGSIIVRSSGGSGPLNFSINNQSFSTDSIFSQLPAGSYAIAVVDSAGCMNNQQVQINSPTEIQASLTLVNPACGQNNGSISLTTSGGTGSIQSSLDGINFSPSQQYQQLYAGSYQLFIRDSNNCEITKPVSLSNLQGPKIVSITSKPVKCYNGSDGEIKIIGTGGTGTISYSVDNGLNSQQSNTFSGLVSGTYAVTLFDQNNCRCDSIIIIAQPDSLQLLHQLTPETCTLGNGFIHLSATGGLSPYVFSIDSGYTFSAISGFNQLVNGVYHVAVKDIHQCITRQTMSLANLSGPQIIAVQKQNISCFGLQDGLIEVSTQGGNGILNFSLDNFNTSQTDSVFNLLPQGVYTVSVSDSNNCSHAVTVSLMEPAVLTQTTLTTKPSCYASNDGMMSVTPLGGTPPYNIQWNNGNTDFNLSGAIAGTYSFVITDANNCQSNDLIVLHQPDSLNTQVNVINGSCHNSQNGSAMVMVNGGTAPYQYQWSPISGNTNYANALPAGNYTVIITDAKGCTTTQLIQINNPAPVSNFFLKSDVTCFGGADGSLTAQPAGGTGPYQYLWSYQQITTATVQNLSTGIYTVTITDHNGCSSQFSEQILSPAIIKPDDVIETPTCNGFNDGNILLNVSGGTAPYTYNWSNNTSLSYNQNLGAGVYVVTVSDAHGCTKMKAFTLSEPPPIQIVTNWVDTLCIGQQAVLSCIASGGVGNYSWNWSTQESTPHIMVQPTVTSTYYVWVSDSNHCPSPTDSIMVRVFPPIDVTVSLNDTICSGSSIQVSAVAGGGNGGPYTYLWSNGSNAANITVAPLQSTTYVVTVSDQCTVAAAQNNTTITVNPTPQFNLEFSSNEGCEPLEVHFFNQSNYPQGTQFSWDFGDGTLSDSISPTHTYMQAGAYPVQVIATTPQNCTASFISGMPVMVYPLPLASFTVTPNSVTILKPEITLVDSSELATQWYYHFGDGYESVDRNAMHTYKDTGTYTIQQIVTSIHGCTDTTYREITIEGAFTIYIPNAFTPNNDGMNDNFYVTGFGISELSMQIFNRWGNKVFDTTQINGSWNGNSASGANACPQGVYVYTIKVKDQFGRYHSYHGQLTLIR
jgi:gliding motility-associated-like protein